jgi:type I restriction enzyme S subunit
MSDLPVGWALTPLENCGEWGSGGTPTRTNPLYYQNGTIPWLIIGDLNDGIVTKAATHITQAGLENSSAKLLPVDTLLVAMYGSIGKLGITGIECATNQAIAYCKPNTDVALLKYLFYALMNSKDALLAQGQGGAQQNINQGILKAYNIPLAPLDEQKRIAEKLDTLLTRVDSCERHLERVPQILKRFRQSVLAAATSGRLTEDWREKQGRDLSDWTETTVGNLIEDIEAGINYKCEERPPLPHERGLVKISAVTWSEFNDEESKTLPTSRDVPESTRIKVGDFLISRANTIELVAACVIVKQVNRPVYLSDKVLRIVMRDEIKMWLLYWLRSSYGRSQIESLASGNQLSMRNISQANLKLIQVNLPKQDEIDEIVRRVEKLFAYAERLEARYLFASERVERLTPSLLAKAFRGELVEQDAEDESAEVLLERIRVSQETSQTKTKKLKPQRKKKDQTKSEAAMLKRNEIQQNHLSSILKERGRLTAEELWNASQLEIDEFYDQLKAEEENKLLREIRGEDDNSARLLEAV